MKKLLIFILVYGFDLVFAENSATLPLSRIISEFYVNKSVEFDFFVQDSKAGYLNDILNDILKVKADVPQKIIKFSGNENGMEINRSAVLLFIDVAGYIEFHKRFMLNNQYLYSKSFYFTIFISDFTHVRNINFSHPMIKYESFLVMHKINCYCLKAFVMFNQPNCRKWTERIINQFEVRTKSWTNESFFIGKLNDFNGCELVISVPVPYYPAFTITYNEERTKITGFEGFGIEIIELISKDLNFSVAFNPYHTIFLKYFHSDQRIDARIDYMRVGARSVERGWFSTHPIETIDEVIIISHSVPYTQFEKLFLPFEIEVWLCLIILLSIAILTIVVISFMSKTIQKFVFGTRVKTPMVNLV